MSDSPADDDPLARYIAASADLLGLTIDPAWRDAVLTYFKGMEAAARLVDGFALPDEFDPAPVFSA